MVEPPEEVYAMTCSIDAAPDTAQVVEIAFEQGNPVAIDGVRLDPVSLIRRANALAGGHGFGRLDMIENRVVGIKSREIYETPGLLLLIKAHQELESLTLAADVLRTKRQLEMSWADLVYQGLWYGPLKDALDGFIERTQRTVTGSVRLKLHKGNATVIGRSSATDSLYVPDMATYDAGDQFDHRAAEGFIYVWGLPTRLWAASQRGSGGAWALAISPAHAPDWGAAGQLRQREAVAGSAGLGIEAQPHFTRHRSEQLNLLAEFSVVVEEQLLPLQHRLQPLLELALEDLGDLIEQGF